MFGCTKEIDWLLICNLLCVCLTYLFLPYNLPVRSHYNPMKMFLYKSLDTCVLVDKGEQYTYCIEEVYFIYLILCVYQYKENRESIYIFV